MFTLPCAERYTQMPATLQPPCNSPAVMHSTPFELGISSVFGQVDACHCVSDESCTCTGKAVCQGGRGAVGALQGARRLK